MPLLTVSYSVIKESINSALSFIQCGIVENSRYRSSHEVSLRLRNDVSDRTVGNVKRRL